MPHCDHGTACNNVAELPAQNGFDGMTQAIEILMNETMKFERGNVLRAAVGECVRLGLLWKRSLIDGTCKPPAVSPTDRYEYILARLASQTVWPACRSHPRT